LKKILLIDDHFVVRSGIQGLFSEIYRPCEVHEAEDGESATEKLRHNEYDLVMMDIQMPKTDTLGFMEYIHIKYPKTKVLIFSMSAEKIYAKRFLKAGAKGFLSKSSTVEEITKAINLVIHDRKYISESLALSLAEEYIGETVPNPFNKLSSREFEIATLLLSGNTNSNISGSLNIHSSTIGTHKTRLFEKLGVANILELKELANGYNF
jgi:two-component system invasion response regulator UvrY